MNIKFLLTCPLVKSYLGKGFYLDFVKKVKCILEKMKIIKYFLKYSLKVQVKYFLHYIFSLTFFVSSKTSWRRLANTSWKGFNDVLQRNLEYVLQTPLEDVLKDKNCLVRRLLRRFGKQQIFSGIALNNKFIKGALMQIWKSVNIFVFIWK